MKNTDQNYELTVIFSPNTSVENSASILETNLSNIKSKLVTINRDGLKNLSYPIKKNTSGIYYTIQLVVELENIRNINSVIQKLNVETPVLRYLIVNQNDYLKLKSKEVANDNLEFISHRELNKGKQKAKKCYTKYSGAKVYNYSDVQEISQFVSPYSKIFGKVRTGSSSKYQRKISKAVKQARHLAYMSFTDKYIR